MSPWQPVLATLASGSCYALMSVLQHRAVHGVDVHAVLHPGLLVRLLREPLWLLGLLFDAAAIALHALALALGEISLVQPLTTSGLLLAVPLEALFWHRRPVPREVAGVLLASAGLAVFLLVARPSGGGTWPAFPEFAYATAGCALAVAGCVALARGAAPAPRAALLGTATGVVYGLTAPLVKINIGVLAEEGLPLVFLGWPLYALALAWPVGLLLNQNAFQSGPLSAGLTSLTLVNPLVGTAIGVYAFGEHLRVDGVAPLVETIAITAIGYGIWLVGQERRRAPAPTA